MDVSRFRGCKRWVCGLVFGLLGLIGQIGLASDIAYIGDWGTNSVKEFDATTGTYLGTLLSIASSSSPPLGLNGLIFDQNHNLLVVNQNVNQPYNGAVLRYNASTGAPLSPLVPQTDPNGPWAPRGIVIGKDGSLYVADMGNVEPPTPPGSIDVYNATTGAFVKQITAPGLPGGVQFQPRGLVFGPDGNLYVTNFEDYTSNGGTGLGSILRFNPTTGAYTTFVSRDGISGGPPLLSPEGLTFGPNGNLYALSLGTSTPGSPQDDYIIEYNGNTGTYLNSVDIGTANNSRLAATILFGPNDKLFVPMQQTGEVREYDMNLDPTYTDFIPAGGPLVGPWFMTFGNTNPGTLQYVPEPSTFTLLGVGAVGLLGYVWRRRRQPT